MRVNNSYIVGRVEFAKPDLQVANIEMWKISQKNRKLKNLKKSWYSKQILLKYRKRQYTAKVQAIRTFYSEAVRSINRNITMRENYLENKSAWQQTQ